jgi:iron complex transport system substrate-binding protein
MSVATVFYRSRRTITGRLPLLAPIVIIGLLALTGTVYPDSRSASSPPSGSLPVTSRIVCLCPALTQMIRDLGLTDSIIAVGAFDPVAPPAAAVVGDLYQIDYEKLLALAPTHVIVQAVRQPVPPRLNELAAAHRFRVTAWPIESATDVLHILRGTPQMSSLGQVLGRPAESAALADRIEQQLAAIAAITVTDNRIPRPRTLLVVGTSPLTAAGPGTLLHDMLQIAGGTNALPQAAILYPVLDRERLLALRPDVIIVVTSDGTRSAAEQEQRLNLPASLRPRILHVVDPAALLPSSTMPRIAAAIARQLHPALSDQLDAIERSPAHDQQDAKRGGQQDAKRGGSQDVKSAAGHDAERTSP